MERIVRKQSIVIPDTVADSDNETLLNKYLEDAECRGLTKRTIENYKSCLMIFSNFVDKPLMGVEICDLKDFLIKEKQICIDIGNPQELLRLTHKIENKTSIVTSVSYILLLSIH